MSNEGGDPTVTEAVAAITAARELLDRKIADRHRLDAEIAALRVAITGRERGPGEKGPRGATKELVLRLLGERPSLGLNARTAVELAAGRGEQLRPATVSSLLSRLRSDGVVTFDGRYYKLREKR